MCQNNFERVEHLKNLEFFLRERIYLGISYCFVVDFLLSNRRKIFFYQLVFNLDQDTTTIKCRVTAVRQKQTK
jgi:hypothetical protein